MLSRNSTSKPTVRQLPNNFFQVTVCGFFLLITSCQSPPKKPFRTDVGQWKAQAHINHFEARKKGFFNLDIIARPTGSLRMEAYAQLGVHLASIAMSAEKASIILLREKKFIEGKSGENILFPLTGVRLDPRVLNQLLFTHQVSLPGWSCTSDKEAKTCQDQSSGVEINWIPIGGSAKWRSEITGKNYSLKILFEREYVTQEVSEEVFQLHAPKGFKTFFTH